MTAPPSTSIPVRDTGGGDLLRGLRVVEHAQGVAAPFAAKILADFGAGVVKIEPPTGDATRRDGPFPHGLPHRETSAVFLQHNTSKRSVRLDTTTCAGRRLLDALLQDAHVFLSDLTLARATPLALDPPTLHAHHPRLLVAAVTPYGLQGPDAEIPATPLTVAHRSASAYNLVNVFGTTFGPPLPLGGRAFEADAGLAAALAIVAALLARDDDGLPPAQLIDVALQDALTSLDRVDNSIAVNGPTPPSNFVIAHDARLPCKDGLLIVTAGPPHQWRALIRLIGDPPWAFDAQGELLPRKQIRARVRETLGRWAADRTRAEVYRATQEAGAPTGPVLTPSEVLDSAQQRARGFFEPLDHPHAGPLRYPRFAARFLSPSAANGSDPLPDDDDGARTAAPRLGQHTAALLAPHLAPWSAAQARRAGIA